MVVTSDLGDSLDVHPKQKYQIGERMSKVALAKVYNKKIEYRGSIVLSYYINKSNVIINFAHGDGLQPSIRKDIVGFEIMGSNKLYYPARVISIQNNSLIITSTEVIEPIAVRYVWQPFTRANLINKNKLPASIFEIKIKQ
jgi:sialate O-acetylesterase